MTGQILLAVIPWTALLGFFGLLLRVRVSGDPALWKRIEALELKLEQQSREFDKKLQDERADCAKKLAEMEGRIRQLQQQQTSFGNVSDDRPLASPLRKAFPAQEGNQDNDLIRKLDREPGRKRKP